MTSPVSPSVDRDLLVVAALCLAVVLVALALAVLVGRWWLRVTDARRARRVASARPWLVQLVAGDDEDPVVVERLVAVDPRTWRALEPVAVAMLGKVRGEARTAVVGLLERRGSVERAMRGVHRRSAVVRARSAHLLGAVGGPGVTVQLVRLLGDRDMEVRAVAVRALGRLADPMSATALVHGLLRTPPLPHHLVMAALRRIGPAAVRSLLAAADQADDLVRAQVAEALGLIGAVATAPVLVAMLRTDRSTEVRLRAARALGRIGAPVSVDDVIAATSAREPLALRVTAAEALGALGARRAVPVLADLVDDPVHWVAHTAAASLAAIRPYGVAALARLAGRSGSAARHAQEALMAANAKRLLATVRP
ncbi:HEAT repeat domain-containing protein [Lentzea sp. DG1S-22]|uniref:HEAT repeat domain-containing protein n=1 Tax=Lentzea sp. DG1S-22 TaxID=3108822 RepID=UPI002E7739FD|nr:HEAT repeat domain-containing protein [Lentzea sp. DG1S-22]WVH82274.1 HEAT repeat domain-containing protein [Lentzea sp. DG1S-22]